MKILTKAKPKIKSNLDTIYIFYSDMLTLEEIIISFNLKQINENLAKTFYIR